MLCIWVSHFGGEFRHRGRGVLPPWVASHPQCRTALRRCYLFPSSLKAEGVGCTSAFHAQQGHCSCSARVLRTSVLVSGLFHLDLFSRQAQRLIVQNSVHSLVSSLIYIFFAQTIFQCSQGCVILLLGIVPFRRGGSFRRPFGILSRVQVVLEVCEGLC